MTTRTRGYGILVPTQWDSSIKSKGYDSCTTGNPYSDRLVSSWTSTEWTGYRKTMTDVVVPKFHARRSRGEIFMNPMSAVEQTVEPAQGNGTLKFLDRTIVCPGLPYQHQVEMTQGPVTHVDRLTGYFPSFQGNFVPFPALYTPSELADVLGEASTECLSNRGRPSSTNLWESLAEIEKSRALLPDLFQSMSRLVDMMGRSPYRKRGGKADKGRSILAAAKASGNAYLLARYGLRPLVLDAVAILEAMRAKAASFDLHTARGSSSTELFRSTTTLVEAGNYTATQRVDVKQTISARAMSLDQYQIDVMDSLGLTGKNLVTLPWELVPYSFVVDWFTNVGDVIGALVQDPRLVQRGACTTYRIETEMTAYLLGYTPKSTAVILQPASGSKRGVQVEKIRVPSLSGIRFVMRQKPFIKADGSFNLARFLDANALLVQRLIRA